MKTSMQIAQDILSSLKTVRYAVDTNAQGKPIVHKPDELMKYKVGTCLDQALFANVKLQENKVLCTMYFICIKNLKYTHAFNLFSYEKYMCWLESAFKPHFGIHKYSSTREALFDIISKWKKDEKLSVDEEVYLFKVNSSELLKVKELDHNTFFTICANGEHQLDISTGKYMKDIGTETLAPNISKRKLVEDKILKHVKMMDPTGTNHKRYREMFGKMTDANFDQFMHDLRDKKAALYMLFPNMKISMKMENLLKTADSLGLKITERIKRKDPITGKTYITPNEYLILKLPVRRARQFLKGKMAVSESDTHIDALTGQVVKPDRASAMSYVETQLLYAKDLNKTITELIKVRGGDVVAYAQFKQQLEETGQAHLNALDPNTVAQSSITAATLLTSMMFTHNLVETRSL